MGKQKGLMRVKKYIIDYNEIGRVLRSYCFNVNDLFEDGLCGKMVKLLCWLYFRKKQELFKVDMEF